LLKRIIIIKKFDIQFEKILKHWVIITIKLLILIIIAKRRIQTIKTKIATTKIITKSKTTWIRLFKIIV